MRPVLITAGATRNPIDSMRFISAHASGRTGAWLAGTVSHLTKVHAMCSPEAALRMPTNVETEVFSSTHDLMERMRRWLTQNPTAIAIHSAAVGDYEVHSDGTANKIPSGQTSLSVTLAPTPKILDHIKEWSPDGHIISFKAAAPNTAPDALHMVAQQQAARTRSTLVFANVIGDTDGTVLVVDADGFTPYSTRMKGLEALRDHVIQLCGEQT